VIEVTNDFSNSNPWVEIDRRDNCPDLNERVVVKAFAISRPPSGKFRYIRLRQTGVNSRNNHRLGIAAFDMFSELRMRTAMLR
jgi:hypothetical protein